MCSHYISLPSRHGHQRRRGTVIYDSAIRHGMHGCRQPGQDPAAVRPSRVNAASALYLLSLSVRRRHSLSSMPNHGRSWLARLARGCGVERPSTHSIGHFRVPGRKTGSALVRRSLTACDNTSSVEKLTSCHASGGARHHKHERVS